MIKVMCALPPIGRSRWCDKRWVRAEAGMRPDERPDSPEMAVLRDRPIDH